MYTETKSGERRGRIIAYASLILWIGVIFYLSSSQGSMDQTSRFIRPLLEFLFPAAPEETLRLYHGYIRKFAHFAEYAVLAFLTFRAFRSRLDKGIWSYFVPLIVVLLVASLDELNQSFESDRTGTYVDVLLDLSGGIASILVLWAIYRRRATGHT